MTHKVVPDGPDLPLIPITSHTRKGAEWLMAQINANSMQINVPWLIFMVTSSLFDFEYKQCVQKELYAQSSFLLGSARSIIRHICQS